MLGTGAVFDLLEAADDFRGHCQESAGTAAVTQSICDLEAHVLNEPRLKHQMEVILDQFIVA